MTVQRYICGELCVGLEKVVNVLELLCSKASQCVTADCAHLHLQIAGTCAARQKITIAQPGTAAATKLHQHIFSFSSTGYFPGSAVQLPIALRMLCGEYESGVLCSGREGMPLKSQSRKNSMLLLVPGVKSCSMTHNMTHHCRAKGSCMSASA